MPQITNLIHTLKQILKTHKKTYADVAKELGLSEGSVKRLFAEESFSLARLEQICLMLDMEISDLVQVMQERSQRITSLTREQEEEITGDLVMLLVTVCALNRWTLQDIITSYKISETQAIHYLAALDRMRLIELLPGNRIKLLVSPNFHWIANGPIQKFFHEKVGKDFFNSRFDRQNEKLIVANAMLTRESNAIVQKKLDKLLREIDQLNDEDAGISASDKKGATVVMAVREWNYGVFSGLRR